MSAVEKERSLYSPPLGTAATKKSTTHRKNAEQKRLSSCWSSPLPPCSPPAGLVITRRPWTLAQIDNSTTASGLRGISGPAKCDAKVAALKPHEKKRAPSWRSFFYGCGAD
jgi:hypothetical protein